MTIKDLIEKLKKFPEDTPICINDYMGFAEQYEEAIIIEPARYISFPFTENDAFDYINLKSAEKEVN